MPDGCTTIFLHLPKAGGSTLNRIISRQYGPHEIYKVRVAPRSEIVAELNGMPAEQLRGLRMIIGHAAFGLHAAVPKPCSYITILRDPIERVISQYYYILRMPGHQQHQVLARGEQTLAEYARFVGNGQTRLISGLESNATDALHLQTAKANLENHFSLVGLTESFDQFLVLLSAELGWKLRGYRRANVTAQRPPAKMVPASTLAAIRAGNALDLELYLFARELFQRRARAQGIAFPLKVAALKLLNLAQRMRGALAGRARAAGWRANPPAR
jgi:hypothetical protein